MHIGEFILGVSLRMIGVMIYCAITKVFFLTCVSSGKASKRIGQMKLMWVAWEMCQIIYWTYVNCGIQLYLTFIKLFAKTLFGNVYNFLSTTKKSECMQQLCTKQGRGGGLLEVGNNRAGWPLYSNSASNWIKRTYLLYLYQYMLGGP